MYKGEDDRGPTIKESSAPTSKVQPQFPFPCPPSPLPQRTYLYSPSPPFFDLGHHFLLLPLLLLSELSLLLVSRSIAHMPSTTIPSLVSLTQLPTSFTDGLVPLPVSGLVQEEEGQQQSTGTNNQGKEDPTPMPSLVISITQPTSSQAVCHTCQLSFSSVILQRQHFQSVSHHHAIQRRIHSLDSTQLVTSRILVQSKEEGSPLHAQENFIIQEEPTLKRKVIGSPFLWYTVEALPEFKFGFWKKVMLPQDKYSSSDPPSTWYQAQASAIQGRWAILCLSGGFFAGAILDPCTHEILNHKTFRRYTTRRKQGGSQMAFDRKSGRAARSAGASLRRANEVQLEAVGRGGG